MSLSLNLGLWLLVNEDKMTQGQEKREKKVLMKLFVAGFTLFNFMSVKFSGGTQNKFCETAINGHSSAVGQRDILTPI